MNNSIISKIIMHYDCIIYLGVCLINDMTYWLHFVIQVFWNVTNYCMLIALFVPNTHTDFTFNIIQEYYQSLTNSRLHFLNPWLHFFLL